MGININQKNKRVVLHFTATGSVNVAGNSTSSDIATGDEVLTGAYIRRIWWGCNAAAATWTVQRGSNTVVVLNGSGSMDFSEAGSPIIGSSTSNVVATLAGGAGFIMIDLAKIGTFTSNSYSSS